MATFGRWRIGLSLALFVLVAIVLVLAVAAPSVIGRKVEHALYDAGFVDADINGVSFSFGPSIRIGRLSLSADDVFLLSDIRADISLAGFRQGKIDRLTIGHLHLALTLSQDGTVLIPGYRPVQTTEASALPVDVVHLKAADISVRTDQGPIALTLREASLEKSMLHAVLSLHHSLVEFEGRLDAAVTQEGRPKAVSLRLDDGAFGSQDRQIGGLTGTAMLDLEGNRFGARLRAGGVDQAVSDLQLRVTGNQVTQNADIAIAGTVQDMAALAALLSQPLPLSGRAQFSTAALLEWHDGFALSGDMTLEVDDASMDGYLSDGDASLKARLYGDLQGIVLYTDMPWTARLQPVTGRLPEFLAAGADKRLFLSLAARSEGGPLFNYDLETGAMGLDGHLAVEAGDSTLTADGVFDFARTEAGFAVTGEVVTLSLTGLNVAGPDAGMVQLAQATAIGRLHWDGADGFFEGVGDIAAGVSTDAMAMDGLSLAMPDLRLSFDGDAFHLSHSGCMTLSVAALQTTDIDVSGLEGLCLTAEEEGDIIRLDEDGGGAFALALKEGPLALSVRAGEENYQITGRWPQMALDATLSRYGVREITLQTEGGTIHAPQQHVSLSGLTASVELADGAMTAAAARIDTIENTKSPALWSPLSLELTAEQTGGQSGGHMTFEAYLSDLLGLMVVEAKGTHGPDGGGADFTLYPISFIPDAVEPGDLSPGLAGSLSDVTGTIGLNGKAQWTHEGVTGAANISLDDLSGRVDGIGFSGVSGDIRFDSLLPLGTPSAQHLTIAAVNPGVPLLNGDVTFQLSQNTLLSVEALKFGLAGGTIGADPFIVDLTSIDDLRLVLQAENVDLAQIFEIGGVNGLSGDGKLHGRIPLALTEEGLSIDDGLLQAAGTGVLHYIPDDLPAFMRGDDMRSQMLRQALQNFQYESLSLSLSGRLDDTQQLVLSARGANPDFLDGHPVELNFNISGALAEAVKSAVGAIGLEKMFRDKQQENNDEEGEIKP